MRLKRKTNIIKPIAVANHWHKIWRDFGPNTYPIDIDYLVKEAINNSSDGDHLTFEEQMFDNPNFQGMFRKRGPADYVAILNANIRSRGRRNFTKAHELFHFLGHRKISDEFICGLKDLSDYDENQLEAEANAFASQMLLPPDLIRPHLDSDFVYDNVKELSENLSASVAAVAYKMLSLSGSKKIAFFQSVDGFILKGYSSNSAYQRGIYFKSGMELPPTSITRYVQNGGNQWQGEFEQDVWHPKLGGYEYVHQTSYEDFTYTFLTFY